MDVSSTSAVLDASASASSSAASAQSQDQANAVTQLVPDLSEPTDSGPPPVDDAASPRGSILSAVA